MKYQGDFLINRILEDMSDGVIVIGFDGTIMLYNSAAERILGMSDDMLRGKNKIVKTLPCFRGEETLYLRITTDFLTHGDEKIGVIAQLSDITEGTMLFIANKRLANQITELMHSFVEIMVTAIDEKSPYNANHTKSMVKYAKRYLCWLDEQGILNDFTSENTSPLLMSIWLHDIGKLLVPPEVMDKPTRLGNAEMDILHRIKSCILPVYG